MPKGLLPAFLATVAVCLLAPSGSRLYAQENDISRDRLPDSSMENRDDRVRDEAPKARPNGIVNDWSMHHLAYPHSGPVNRMIALQNDPRAILSWQAEARQLWRRGREPRPVRTHEAGFHPDWSISLGSGTTAPGMYPAKYNLLPTATPSCASDFIVFPIDASSGSSQPDIVAFNNLYSGTAGTDGICNAPADGRTTGADDDGVSATVLWSYNVVSSGTSGSSVATSPALSLDGTKVAFVENNGTASWLVVLAPAAGNGQAANLQTVTSPALIDTFTTNAPVAGSGTASHLQLNASATVTLSSPFIDYLNDIAYVGDDSGILYRIINVFCTVNPACTGASPPAPSLDTSWPTTGGTAGTGTINTSCGKLTGPVAALGNVFVGCSNGRLLGFTASTGVHLAGSNTRIGDGSAKGGIVDPPVVDMVGQLLYVASGSGFPGAGSVVAQCDAVALDSTGWADLGSAGVFNLHAPQFNEAYLLDSYASVPNVHGTTTSNSSSGSTSNWQIYEWGVLGGVDTLFAIGFFDSDRDMATGPVTSSTFGSYLEISGSTEAEFSPITRFYNANTGTDQLFASGLTSATPNLVLYNITDFSNLFPNVVFPSNSTSAVGGSASEGHGTSGIVVDNDDSDGQEASIYFGVQSSNTAVKLTQSGLE